MSMRHLLENLEHIDVIILYRDQLRCPDRVADGFPTTRAINAYHH